MGEPERDHSGSTAVAAVRPGSVAPDGATRAAVSRPLRVRVLRGCLRPLIGHFRDPGRPRVWFELLLIGISYWIYSLVRNAVPEMEARAQRNAHSVWSLEQHLGIAYEDRINHAFNSVTWLITGINYDYATLHFIMTIGVLVWLFRSHPGRYAAARLALFVTTAIALFGYYFYPLAPPRLMTGGNFIDTVELHHTWGSMASGDMSQVSNQFAAMPSMHIGWSLWCGLTIAFLARRRWVKLLGLLYPLSTLMVIIASANHFFMDALAGAMCTLVGLAVSRLAYGRWAYAFPQRRETAEAAEAAAAGPADGPNPAEAPQTAGASQAPDAPTGEPVGDAGAQPKAAGAPPSAGTATDDRPKVSVHP
ncbi:phosphatase PAP2 family protein [Streptacidiphilus sp. PB12-B1b]|uniref:phosphatase PAP2 family protein n=1 Tax=Streptacidiphilus sp. PB12-B1b TaxID=2705012 RepID=UPI00351A7092